ncbi:MAG: hypothetical protein EOM67_00550 [Spirochaetia bacterium]|nr:hypothetical protein [Spirochaetia bacterium]
MKPVRLWATTTPEVYKELLTYLATTVNIRSGAKVKLGDFIEMAVIEKLERENKRLQKEQAKKGTVVE